MHYQVDGHAGDGFEFRSVSSKCDDLFSATLKCCVPVIVPAAKWPDASSRSPAQDQSGELSVSLGGDSLSWC